MLHNDPAMTLASNSAPPLTRLKIPKAVPRRSAGAVSATSFESNPWVNAMCRPQKAEPSNATPGEEAIANTISEMTSIPSPINRSVRAEIRSAAAPAGYANIGIDNIHRNHDYGHVADSQPDVLGTQNQKRLTKTS